MPPQVDLPHASEKKRELVESLLPADKVTCMHAYVIDRACVYEPKPPSRTLPLPAPRCCSPLPCQIPYPAVPAAGVHRR